MDALLAVVLVAGILAAVLFDARFAAAPTGLRRALADVSGGATIAYAFLVLVPKLSDSSSKIGALAPSEQWSERGIGLFLALVGFVGLRLLTRRVVAVGRRGATRASWVLLGAVAAYYVALAKLVVDQVATNRFDAALLALAVALHLIAEEPASEADRNVDGAARTRRIVLAAALVAGMVLGLADALHGTLAYALTALVAGALLSSAFEDEELEETSTKRTARTAVAALAVGGILVFVG